MKVTIESIEQVLRSRKVEAAKIVQIVTDLENAAKEEKADREPVQKSKKQLVVIFYEGTSTGSILQIEEAGNPADVVNRVKAVAAAFNESRKGRKHPVSTIAQTFESVPRRFWKTDDGKTTIPKTKETIYLVSSSNSL